MENNKLIGEFMCPNWELLKKGDYEEELKGNFFIAVCLCSKDYTSLKFHKSWDWLMKVVDKIESLGYLVEIRDNVCFVKTSETDYFSELENTKLEATYKATVVFIEWHNKNFKT
jgi:hypothetical protein